MAVYLSPGVFPREIDLSVLPNVVGPTRPAFIGTTKKGRINKPIFVANAERFIDAFGEPITDSNLGYAVLAYFEQGSDAYVMRVGVECELGQADELAGICIDTSGANVEGFGRIPVFQGIDHGRLRLRPCTVDTPYAFHDKAVEDIQYVDVDAPDSCGVTAATLSFSGVGLSDQYNGAIDDSFIILITQSPSASSGSVVDGAKYQIIRNSDGNVIASGTVVESGVPGTSDPIDVGTGSDDTGLKCAIVVTGICPIEEGDVFQFRARPDNRTFEIAVEGISGGVFSFGSVTYTTNTAFVAAFNALVGAGPDYRAIVVGDAPQVIAETAGERIQIINSNAGSVPAVVEAWALEVGTALYTYDIPRSCLVGTESSPFVITTANDRIKITIVGPTSQAFNISIPTGTAMTAEIIASAIHAGGILYGNRYFESFAIEVASGDVRLVIVTVEDHQYEQVKLEASFSNIKSLKFAEEVGIQYPYTRAYRGYSDPRVELPTPGTVTPSVPYSCELDPGGADCLADTTYFQNIVGWAVAKSAGTWILSYDWTLEVDTTKSGKYISRITDINGMEQDRIDDVSFDPSDGRYIANIVNENSSLGGTNGNAYFNWEERPAFLVNGVREPGPLYRHTFNWTRVNGYQGPSDGIPSDPSYSSEIDRAIIGNPSLATGLFGFQNPEEYDINLLIIPGVSSGAVIGQGLQLCESRGDMLFIIDPPFGLRPQQVVDWHNGILTSDLTSAINSSYGALYWSWVKIFDQFSGQNIYIPPSGHVAAVYSRTARDTEQWYAPAGLTRGRLLTVLDLEFTSTQSERDLLYGSGNAVNPIAKFTQDGIVVFGQRTLQRKASALDRVNVRMLLIFLKKSLTRLLRNYLFEPNDSILRAQVVDAVNPFLSDVQARRGMTGFKVVCDETNNTPERIDRNELWVSVFIKPTRAVEFIVLNLVILRTEQSFSAEEVLAAGGVVSVTV